MPDKLIIFDYSGTLSLEMAAFARPRNLLKHLQSSGLHALGVNNADLFWEIINATWMKGSLTNLGYKKVMTERILELFPEQASTGQTEISAAVAAFVDDYFANSRIDNHWRPVLKKLSQDKSVSVIIATDHYAEATCTITKFLNDWQIPAKPLIAGGKGNFVVANSADLGVHKEDGLFWEIVKTNLPAGYEHILLIDDFGQNEQQGDAYGNSKKVTLRQKMSINLLKAVFNADIKIIPFISQDKSDSKLICKVSQLVDLFLQVK